MKLDVEALAYAVASMQEAHIALNRVPQEVRARSGLERLLSGLFGFSG